MKRLRGRIINFGRSGITIRRLTAGDQDPVVLKQCRSMTLARLREGTDRGKGISRRVKDFGSFQGGCIGASSGH